MPSHHNNRGKAVVLALSFLMLAAMFLTLASSIGVHALGTPAVWTDKADYAPEETVTIYGVGFTPGMNLDIIVIRPDGSIVRGDGTFIGGWDSVQADASGAFVYAYILDGIQGLYEVRAYASPWSGDLGSAPIASTVFSDATGANLDQGKNGGQVLNKKDEVISPVQWINGNLGPEHSHFIEGYSIPYRAQITDTTKLIGTTQYVDLGYEIRHGGKNALDYLTTFNRLDDASHSHMAIWGHAPEVVDPTVGTAFTMADASTYPIPAPAAGSTGQPTISFNNLTAAERLMTIFGGTITNMVYVSNGDLTASNSEAILRVYFTIEDDNVLLAWGGHIASRLDWGYINGVPNSAGGISGSPYHMHFSGQSAALGNFGAQDVSLKSVAIWDVFASVTVYKYEDMNGNGVRDTGDLPLAGWTMQLKQGTTVIRTGVTDAEGKVTWTDVAAGTYDVVETLDTGWYCTNHTGGQILAQVLEVNGDYTFEFLNTEFISIDVYKFEDMNGNGVRESGDNALADWTIELRKQSDNSLVDSDVTDASGLVEFDNVVPGVYKIVEVLPANWYCSNHTGGVIASLTLASGDDVRYEFLNTEYVTIDVYKFEDMNGNGVRDAGDNALAGWTIELRKQSDDSLVASGVTDASGRVQFTGVVPGTYKIVEVIQTNWYCTNHTGGVISSLTFASGDVGRYEFLNTEFTTIDVYKYEDMNGNGVRNVGDNALAGWTIELRKQSDDSLVASGVTDASGRVQFTGVVPGTYKIVEVVQTNWYCTNHTDGIISSLTYVSGDVGRYEFLNTEFITIDAYKYEDMNGNGVRDAGDNALSGWTIELLMQSDDSLVTSGITDAAGHVQFTGVVPGTYKLVEVVQTNWYCTNHTGGIISSLTFASGDVMRYEFLNTEFITIDVYKFEDMNGNGVRNVGDNALAGWTIELRMQSDDSLVDSGLTDVNGFIRFTDVIPGTYKIVQIVQTGWYCTNHTDGLITSETVVSGDHKTYEFLDTQFITVDVYKFEDMNGNGVREAGDNALAGWTIELRMQSDDSLVDSGVTNAAGLVEFTNVMPGVYKIVEVVQANWYCTNHTDGIISSLTYVSGDVMRYEFLNTEFITIDAYKYEDMNGNGVREAGDNALAGWTIELRKQSDDSLVASGVTDASGRVQFTSVVPGTYKIVEVVQANWYCSNHTDGVIASQTLVSGDVMRYEFLNTEFITIDVYKFEDMNGNGVRDAGDNALAGWTIELRKQSDDALVDSGVTNGAGRVEFTGVIPGTYNIVEVVQSNWYCTNHTDGIISSATLVSGDVMRYEFLNTEFITIDVYKYEDMNGNGVRDAGDNALEGWLIALMIPVGDPVEDYVPVDAGWTDASGHVQFTGIIPGVYRIVEVVEENWYCTNHTDGIIDPTAFVSGDVMRYEFLNTEFITIDVYKFEDMNGNGVKNVGDGPLAGWTIELRKQSDDSLVDSGLTDVNGFIRFTGIIPGTYNIVQIIQTNWYCTNHTDGLITSETVVSGDHKTYEFLDTQFITVDVYKYEDMNGNGVRDAGDNALEGWLIALMIPVGDPVEDYVPVDAGWTDASGHVQFTGIIPGTYRIVEVVQENWYCTNHTDGIIDPAAFVSSDVLRFEFLNTQFTTIEVFKYEDMNGNGVRDAGDNALAGWTIELRKQSDNSLVTSGVTDAAGRVELAGVIPGVYKIVEVVQTNWYCTNHTNGIIASQTFVSGDLMRYEFLNTEFITIDVFKFEDMNGNGVKEAGDGPLAGWTIELRKQSDDSLVDSGLTDVNGFVRFTDVIPGTYKIVQIVQTNWYCTNHTDGLITSETVVSGDHKTYEFLDTQFITVDVYKYEDMNGNGVKDAGDNALEGWLIALMIPVGDPVEDYVPVDAGWTDASGHVQFTGIIPGTYRIVEVVQENWYCTNHTDGIIDPAAFVSSDVLRFEFLNTQFTTIEVFKYEDMNGNGVRDAGDNVLAGWTIELRKQSDDSLVDSGVTNAQGLVEFTGIIPGTYKLVEVVQANWYCTNHTDGIIGSVTFVSGDMMRYEFLNTEFITVDVYKYEDMNGNGIRDAGDNALAGWTIELRKQSDDSLVASGVTDAAGHVQFTEVMPGIFKLVEVVQSNWYCTNHTNGVIASVTFVSGDVMRYEFLNTEFITVDVYKYEDMNGNGIKEAGDGPLSGWTIELRKQSDNSLVDSGLTDVNGFIRFTDVIPGTYKIVQIIQTNWYCTNHTDGLITSETVVSGDHKTYEFLDTQFITVDVYKYEDMNGNGVRDAGDNALEGWLIALLIPVGDPVEDYVVIDAGWTDASGHVQFTGIIPGVYRIVEVVEENWYCTNHTDGIIDPAAFVSGDVMRYEFLNTEFISIDVYKFEDMNGNGVRDAGDNALAGWTIELRKQSDDGLVTSGVTNAQGLVEFTGIIPGTYKIVEVVQDNWYCTNHTNGVIVSQTFVSGNVVRYEFLNFELGEINGYKFNDLDRDGVWDSDEVEIEGWVIYLTGHDTILDVDVSLQTTTDADGKFRFTGLTNGTYTLSEQMPSGWMQTLPGGDGTYIIDIGSGSVVSENFGNWHIASWLSDTSDRRIVVTDFKIVFTPYLSGSGVGYKISATNPGGFYYNILYQAGADETLYYELPDFNNPIGNTVETIPDFVTKGSMPIHAYVWTDLDHDGQVDYWAELSDVTGMISTNEAPGLASGAIDVSGLNAGDTVLFTIHVTFNLKGMRGFTYEQAKLFNGKEYVFSAHDGFDTEATLTAHDPIKQIRGDVIYGLVLDQSADDTPVAGAVVTLYDGQGRMVKSVRTDADGFYMFSNVKVGPYIVTVKLPSGYVAAAGMPLTSMVQMTRGALVQANFYCARA